MTRGNSRKVPLREILPINEITPRGPLGKGSKIPKDLPTAYENKLKGVSYVLVDGYQRYKAITKEYGLETRVPIEELEGNTMADLMLAAYEANEKHPLLLTQDEKKAHVFRLMLNGVLMDKSIDQLHKMFSHFFGRTTIADYKNASKFAREEAQLEGLSPEQVIAALREHLSAPAVDLINPRYDSKGYPLKETVVGWKSVAKTGDITELLAKREREEEQRQSKEREALADFASTAQGYDEKVAVQAAYALIGRLKDKLNDKLPRAIRRELDSLRVLPRASNEGNSHRAFSFLGGFLDPHYYYFGWLKALSSRA